MDEPCPPAEDLGALIDGRLRDTRRDQVMAHVGGCDSCFEVFTGTQEFQRLNPQYGERRGRWVGVFAWAAAAATILGTMLLLPFSRGRSPGQERVAPLAELIPLLRSQPRARGLSEELWRGGLARLRSAEAVALPESSFEAGVLLVGIAVNFEENELEEARARIAALREVLASHELTIEVHDALARAEPRSAAPAGLSQALDEVLSRELSPTFFALGKWAEAGRLAATVGATSLLASKAFRDATGSLLDSGVPPEIATELREVLELGGKAPPSETELARLSSTFTRVIVAGSRS